MGTQLVRGFSTSPASGGLIKTPVQVFGTEGRYASALYSAASKQKALDAVEKDLNAFQAQLNKDKRYVRRIIHLPKYSSCYDFNNSKLLDRLQEFLFDPSVKKGLKNDGLAGACDKLKMNPLSKNLFMAVAENGRYSAIDSIVGSFATLMAAHRGEVVCEITTAKVLYSSIGFHIDFTLPIKNAVHILVFRLFFNIIFSLPALERCHD